MKFIRTKKLVFLNNKGGVGKTTISYNVAVKFAEKGYKTVLVDLDPQCNLSRLALGENFNLNQENNIFGVLKGIIKGGGDINFDIEFQKIKENLSIMPGSLKLSGYQDLLITAYNQATGGQDIGYFQTSAISRFLGQKGLDEQVDIFIIDVSPSLELLNRIILLGVDYFITPLMPDAFSLQGIENLGITLEKWKKAWKDSAKVMAKTSDIPINNVLDGEGLFLGYILNSYNQYSQKPIKFHDECAPKEVLLGEIKKIPEEIKKNISEKHCRNGLVNSTWTKSLIDLKDYGQLPAISHIKSKAIFELIPGEDFKSVPGTKENLDLSKEQFEDLINNLIKVLDKY